MANVASNSYGTDIGAGLGIIGGLTRGGPEGDIQAGASAARLGSNLGIFGENSSAIGSAAGEIGAGLNIVSGLQKGGFSGDSQAAVGAAQLGSSTGAFGSASGAIGDVAGYAAIPLSVYNAVHGWQSGATGTDFLEGAAAGAAIGSVIPGIGTAVGAIIGGVVDAASSALGPGKTDPESMNWNSFVGATGGDKPNAQQVANYTSLQNMSPQGAFNLLAGVMDTHLKNSPITNAFGRMQEGALVNQMTQQINLALASGKIPQNATPQQIFNTVVTPWLNSRGATIGPETGGIQLQGVLTNLIGHWQNGSLNSSTVLTSGGSTDPQLAAYGALGVSSGPSSPTRKASSKAPAPAAAGATAQMTSPASTPAMMGSPDFIQGGVMPSSTMPQNLSIPSGSTSLPGIGAGTAAAGLGAELYGEYTNDPALASLGGFGVAGGLGMFATGNAQNQNAAMLGPVNTIGGAAGNAGLGKLNQAGSNQLTGPEATAVNTSQQQGASLIAAATPVGQIAQQYYKQFSSGNLLPADQAQLDQATTAAKQQVLQALGPNADSTMAAGYFNQIDQQALITKQQMLNNYFATGNTAFDQWAATTQAGQQTILAGQQYAVSQIDKTFEQGLAALGLGGDTLLNGIKLAMDSNTQLSSALQQYMGNLTKAYALTAANGGTMPGLGALKNIFGGGSSSPGAPTSDPNAPPTSSAATDWNTTGWGPTQMPTSGIGAGGFNPSSGASTAPANFSDPNPDQWTVGGGSYSVGGGYGT